MSARRFDHFVLDGRQFAGVGNVIRACEAYAAQARRPWRAALVGVVADDQVGAGAQVYIASAVGESDGSVEFEGLEPSDGVDQ